MITNSIRQARIIQTIGVTFVGIVVSAACGSGSKAADSSAATVPSPPPAANASAPARPQAPVARFTKAQFDRLRWLVGDWRGKLANGQPFYQTFQMVNDSTMMMGGVTDSTFKKQTDSNFISFRGGRVINRGNGSPWLATRLDTVGVSFASLRDSTDHFEWNRVSANKWTANMFKPNDRGVEQKTVFQLERVKRK